MNNMKLICQLDDKETIAIEDGDTVLNLNDNKQFTYAFKNTLNRLPNVVSSHALDLLYISLFVFAADRLILRDAFYDSWSRKITLAIPVISCDMWNSQKFLLKEMLDFLSGDEWFFEFRERKFTAYEEKAHQFFSQLRIQEENVNTISMFSGGLDSFIGAIDLLSKQQNVVFVSHYGGGKGEVGVQNKLIADLCEHFSIARDNFYQFFAYAKNGKEDTTRTRSFMFFAHAVALASTYYRPIKLIIPENGLISLNIPLTYSRIGSSSTRTTHPYYMDCFRQLLKAINIPVEMLNPYQFKTKGEMMVECKDKSYLFSKYTYTMSCSHPDAGRMIGETSLKHCGDCLPCVIRRAAIKRAGINDDTDYRSLSLKETPNTRLNLASYLIGFKHFDKKHAFLRIQNSGRLTESLDQYTQLYIRGMNEMQAMLEELNAL